MNQPQALHWPSIGQLALGLLGVAVFWMAAFGALSIGAIGLASNSVEFGDPTAVFLLGIPLVACGFLMLPSVYYPMMRLVGTPALELTGLLSKLKPGWWILALPFVIGLGHLVTTNNILPWLFLPPLHLLAVGIPVAWMLYLTLRRLPTGSSQRFWGVFGSGLSLAPFLIMFFEVIAALGFLILIVVYLTARPDLAEKLVWLADQIREAKTQEAALRIIRPLFSNRLVIALIITFGALVVPLVEEVFKPIGVWLLVGRKITPAAGFAAGALSGAGYGFVESLLLSGNPASWAGLVTARIGTSAVHIFTASLTGWALVQAWQRRRFLLLGAAYLGAVLIHGLWNGLTLLFSIQALRQMGELSPASASSNSLKLIAPAGLALLTLVCFIGLIVANRRLRESHTEPHSTPSLGSSPEESAS